MGCFSEKAFHESDIIIHKAAKKAVYAGYAEANNQTEGFLNEGKSLGFSICSTNAQLAKEREIENEI